VAGRLAAYLEIPYRRDARGFSVDRAFVQFLVALRPHVDELTLVGRVREGRAAYAIPPDVKVHPLPDYPTLKHLAAVVLALPRSLRALDRAVRAADRVLSIGPHPFSLPAALLALARGKDLALMVRQDYPSYIRHRLPSGRWLPAVWLAGTLELVFRLIARRVPTVVVGDALADVYRRAPRLLNLTISLVPAREVGTHRSEELSGRPVRLLSVGRLEPEKAPHLLVELMQLLEERHGPDRFALTVVGTGQEEESVRRAAARFGERIVFAGYVRHGDELFRLYRESDVLVHTALTEGVPQVLIEGQAVGIPIVATDVGGVGRAVGDGTGALLVRPNDAAALADAVERVAADGALRERLVAAGLENAGAVTIERQVEALAAFLGASWKRSAA
jgi:glycosyltransferase involved in cell wall biosynthesis